MVALFALKLSTNSGLLGIGRWAFLHGVGGLIALSGGLLDTELWAFWHWLVGFHALRRRGREDLSIVV